MKQRIQVNALVLMAAILVIVFFPFKIIRQSSFMLDDFWEVLGISCILLGQILRVSARGFKAENSRNGHTLVTDGPYGFVRNPMYLGIIMIGLGVVLMILYPWVFLVFIAGFLYRYVHLFIKEEKALIALFGEKYERYCLRVPRLLPWPWVLWREDISSYVPMRLSWIIKELPAIVIVLLIVIGIESWEEFRFGGAGSMAVELFPIGVILVLFVGIIYLLAKRYETFNEKK